MTVRRAESRGALDQAHDRAVTQGAPGASNPGPRQSHAHSSNSNGARADLHASRQEVQSGSSAAKVKPGNPSHPAAAAGVAVSSRLRSAKVDRGEATSSTTLSGSPYAHLEPARSGQSTCSPRPTHGLPKHVALPFRTPEKAQLVSTHLRRSSFANPSTRSINEPRDRTTAILCRQRLSQQKHCRRLSGDLWIVTPHQAESTCASRQPLTNSAHSEHLALPHQPVFQGPSRHSTITFPSSRNPLSPPSSNKRDRLELACSPLASLALTPNAMGPSRARPSEGNGE